MVNAFGEAFVEEEDAGRRGEETVGEEDEEKEERKEEVQTTAAVKGHENYFYKHFSTFNHLCFFCSRHQFVGCVSKTSRLWRRKIP